MRLETRSAVSSKVNWLIWSTILDTLGFVDAAAVVDSHRLDGALRWRCEIIEVEHSGRGLEEQRNDRAQQRAVDAEDSDIVDNGDI